MSLDLALFTGINILLAWSVYLILLTGTLSFANGAFMALGAYVSGVLTAKFGIGYMPAMAMAAAASAVIGVLTGYPALRTRGIYLILVTLAITFFVQTAIENTKFVGGVQGMGGMMGTSFEIVYGSVIVVGALIWLLSRSPLQRVLDAVREDEHVAGAIGINVVYVRLALFGIGAALAAYAGGLYAHHMFFVAPDHFTIIVSVFIVLYVIMGGVNNMWGSVVGAVILTVLPEAIRFIGEWRQGVFGLLIVILLLFRRDGILPFRSVTARSGRKADA
ncbi:MAG: branched-chain amino acid ABC transporter permease [Alphaproteobacteria bacterium]|nr:branched-chain amino acid ABC transporter permease [Alphaproteobacteria bacterium]